MDQKSSVFHGASLVPTGEGSPSGRLVRAFGEDCYVIENVQALRPFLVSLVSDSDHWLYVTSNGGLTAGRRSPATALFPYVTEDKLADCPGVTGPETLVLATRAGRTSLWKPLAEGDRLAYRSSRRLYKNVLGTRLVFEEENDDLGLCFRSGWSTSDRFGFVRECAISNRGATPVSIRLLDGLLNLLPGDAEEQLQAGYSCLLDAYKLNEAFPGSTLAVYTLAAQVVDRAEPREALHATSVWSHGVAGATVLLTADARAAFARGEVPPARPLIRGQRGAYLLHGGFEVAPGGEQRWLLVADVARTQRDVAKLQEHLKDPDGLVAAVQADVARGSARIEQILASTDGLQRSADPLAAPHHLSNVLFNDLRGGVYALGSAIPGRDFASFVRARNCAVHARHSALLAALPEVEQREAHQARIEATGDPDLVRLSAEYLPLFFSRRHGDPSRPWNRFEIRVKDEGGEPVLAYQGNWRDIFQNWEALSLSFPSFVEQIVAKFVNASTIDGHNPYRIGRDGIDWEVPEPGHPWSTIGYWGDHQIVYLLRLVELSMRHHPQRLAGWLERPLFAYADVPYEIRPYTDIVTDPRNTIRFDEGKHARIQARVRELGSDARLLHDAAGVYRVTLLEKLVVPALAKISAFVPEGGIWMNTQRPEWNDANNALVGYGVSMVTLCYLERYLETLGLLIGPLAGRQALLSREVAAWLESTLEALEAHRSLLEVAAIDDGDRGRLMDALGNAAGAYRATVYRSGFSGTTSIPVDRILEFATMAGTFLRRTIARGRRPDSLFHAYNVLVPGDPGRGFGVQHLEEMLEGQVAALCTPAVDDGTACDMLDALRSSRLYRTDQRSYLLYPDRRLAGFLEKNVIPESALAGAPLLARLLASGDERVVLRDAAGRLRFHGSLHNAEACASALRALQAAGNPEGIDDRAIVEVLEAYEAVFRHRAFTGRSGTMFAYEGLGSIYWHMVGKLLLAVQERFLQAAEAGAPADLLGRLAAHYQSIRAGMGGAEKSPAEWGAFPLDPYSHTPADGGARQPGMTGQVKEEILIRLGELGVLIRGGRVSFRPRLLRRAEFFTEPSVFEPLELDGRRLRLELEPGMLAFTLCQVPVVYRLGDQPRLLVHEADGTSVSLPGDSLDPERSAALFQRTGRLRRIDAWLWPGR